MYLNTDRPGASIIAIATNAPERVLEMEDAKALALERLEKSPGATAGAQIISRMYDGGKIDRRHVAFLPVVPPAEEDILEGRLMKALAVMTPIAIEAAREVMATSGVATTDIGCIVAVSSTVLHEPGISSRIIDALGLPNSVERTPVTFSGCAAGVAGMRVGEDFVKGSPDKCAMVIAYEVSSAHGRGIVRGINGEVIHSIFADGCAAAIVAATGSKFEKKMLDKGEAVVRIRGRRTELVEGTEDGIVLEAMAQAIDCRLSKHLPKYLIAGVKGYVGRLVKTAGVTTDELSYWAIHPGGRRIIESSQQGCGIPNEYLTESYEVLREYGNMLSCAVLFVIKLQMARHKKEEAAGEGVGGEEKIGVAFSFAPGVSVEGFVFGILAHAHN